MDYIISRSILQVTARLVAFQNAGKFIPVATLALIDVATPPVGAWGQSDAPPPSPTTPLAWRTKPKLSRRARDCVQVSYGRQSTGGRLGGCRTVWQASCEGEKVVAVHELPQGGIAAAFRRSPLQAGCPPPPTAI